MPGSGTGDGVVLEWRLGIGRVLLEGAPADAVVYFDQDTQ